MAPSLILARNPDPLWLSTIQQIAGLKTAGSPAMIINLDCPDPALNTPHKLNIVGWRRFLKKLNPAAIRFWGITPADLPQLIAARLTHIPTYLHLIGSLNPTQLTLIRHLSAKITAIHCPTDFITRQLQTTDIPQHKIAVTCPVLPDIPVPAKPDVQGTALFDTPARKSRDEIRRQFLTHDHNQNAPLLLAIESPDNFHQLKLAAWAAALIRHTCPGTVLLVAGQCTTNTRNRINHWQKIWKTQNLIRIVDHDVWPILADACDLILAADPAPPDLIRLFYAAKLKTPLVAPDGPIRQIIAAAQNITLLKSPRPRFLAAAILEKLAP